MTDDPFARYDAAYVLGALTPRDRRDYEAHLSGCPSCAAAVADLAGLPGLLNRVPADRVVEPAPGAGAVPDTLLPRMLAASRAERRPRRRRVVVVGGVAAAAVAAGIVLGAVLAPGDGVDTAPPTGRPIAMTAVRAAPVDATVRLEQVAWGTKVHLRCTYIGGVGGVGGVDGAPARGPYGPLDRAVYRLVVVPRGDGREQTVAQWAVLPGQDATLEGSTDLSPEQIDRMRLETLDGSVLLVAGVSG